MPFDQYEIDCLRQLNGGKIDRLDWMRPICRWPPCEVIWRARDIIIEHLTAVLEPEVESLDAASSNVNTPFHGPRSPQRLSAEKMAILALQDTHDIATGRPSKQDVIGVLGTHLGSKNAARRVWDGAKIPSWRMAGRIPEDSRLAAEQFDRLFGGHFNNQSPLQMNNHPPIPT